MIRRVLLAALAATLLTTQAIAFADSAEPWNEIGSQYLDCVPPLDRGDSNPVVRVHIGMSFKDDKSAELKSLDVVHEFYDMTRVDRTEQYKGGKLWKTRDRTEWYWSGALAKAPALTMVGQVVRDVTGKWWYTENQFKNGERNWPRPITSRCVQAEIND